MSETYSLGYVSRDFKTIERELDFSGNVLKVRTVADFAFLSPHLPEELRRVLCERLASELATKLQSAFLQGWDYSSASAEMDWSGTSV